jgi:hypothetical protein
MPSLNAKAKPANPTNTLTARISILSPTRPICRPHLAPAIVNKAPKRKKPTGQAPESASKIGGLDGAQGL